MEGRRGRLRRGHRSIGLPVAIDRSRSGNRAHAWLKLSFTVEAQPHVGAFWECGALPVDPFGEVQVPPEPAAFYLKRLGPFPFWRENATLAAVGVGQQQL